MNETNALGHITSWTYDGAGNTLTVQRPPTASSNGLTTNTYDSMNRLTSTTDPAVQTTTYAYGRMAAGDGGDTLRMMVDATLKSYTFENDMLGRRTRMTYPAAAGAGPSESWTFDGAGNVKTFTNRAGVGRTHSYDSRNRVTLVSGGGSAVTTTYDSAGRVLAQGNEVATSIYTYNNANELLSETQDISPIEVVGNAGVIETYNPSPRVVSYTYDADGNRATMTYPDATALAYSYTGRNQLDTITSGGVTIVNYNYDPAGNRTSRTVPGSVVSTTTTDAIGRVTYNGFTGAPSNYTYDNAGNVTARSSLGSDMFTYTADNQLDVVSYGAYGEVQDAHSVDFNYDAVGNRTTVEKLTYFTMRDTYTPQGQNQYLHIRTWDERRQSDVQERATYYDTNGNFDSLIHTDALNGGGEGTRTFSYDALNRLTGTTQVGRYYGANGQIAWGQKQDEQTYYYDARNRCVARVVKDWAYDFNVSPNNYIYTKTLTTYTYDDWNVIETFSGYSSPNYPEGSQSAEYVHGANMDEIVRAIGGAGTTYHHHDALGSVIALTNGDGTVVERYKYDVFGQPTILAQDGVTVLAESNFGNKFLFTGREWLPLSGGWLITYSDVVRLPGGNQVGLYDYRNRAYTALFGRFMQTDPIRFDAGDANLYRYVGNRATGATDPMGLVDIYSEAEDTGHVGLTTNSNGTAHWDFGRYAGTNNSSGYSGPNILRKTTTDNPSCAKLKSFKVVTFKLSDALEGVVQAHFQKLFDTHPMALPSGKALPDNQRYMQSDWGLKGPNCVTFTLQEFRKALEGAKGDLQKEADDTLKKLYRFETRVLQMKALMGHALLTPAAVNEGTGFYLRNP